MPSSERRYFGLINMKYLRGLGLCKAVFLDEPGDLPRQLRLGERLLGVLRANIRKDVSTAFCCVSS